MPMLTVTLARGFERPHGAAYVGMTEHIVAIEGENRVAGMNGGDEGPDC